MGENMAAPQDLLLGRRTYDIFAAYWPKTGAAAGAAFTAGQKYVATHRPLATDWANSHSLGLGPDALAAVRALKAQDGPDLAVHGSQNFLQSLIAADLLDEYRLMIFPLILGRGSKLFAKVGMPAGFSLTKSRLSKTGVMMVWHQKADRAATGSFGL